MKKKQLLVVMAVLLMLTVALGACGGSADKEEDTGVVGTWKLTGGEAAGTEITEDQLGAFDYSFTFGDDGSAQVSVMGQSYDTKYTFESDTVTFEDATLAAMTLKKDGDKLVFEETASGTSLFFEKQ